MDFEKDFEPIQIRPRRPWYLASNLLEDYANYHGMIINYALWPDGVISGQQMVFLMRDALSFSLFEEPISG